MIKNNAIQLYLTCADQAEAGKIAKALLAKNLIACAKRLPVSSDFHWQGKIEGADEVLLIMDSEASLFEQIEEEVAKLHSYETFVLQAVPVERTSRAASQWLEEVLNGKPARGSRDAKAGNTGRIKNDRNNE